MHPVSDRNPLDRLREPKHVHWLFRIGFRRLHHLLRLSQQILDIGFERSGLAWTQHHNHMLVIRGHHAGLLIHRLGRRLFHEHEQLGTLHFLLLIALEQFIGRRVMGFQFVTPGSKRIKPLDQYIDPINRPPRTPHILALVLRSTRGQSVLFALPIERVPRIRQGQKFGVSITPEEIEE